MDSNRGDIAEVRHDLRVIAADMDARFKQVESRFAHLESHFTNLLETQAARFEATLEKGLREQTRFFYLAWSVMLAAIVGLYSR